MVDKITTVTIDWNKYSDCPVEDREELLRVVTEHGSALLLTSGGWFGSEATRYMLARRKIDDELPEFDFVVIMPEKEPTSEEQLTLLRSKIEDAANFFEYRSVSGSEVARYLRAILQK